MMVEIKKTCVNKSIVLHSRGTSGLSCCLPVGFTFFRFTVVKECFSFLGSRGEEQRQETFVAN